MTEFDEGQQVELYPTIPSCSGESIEAGTHGVIRAVDHGRQDDAIYLVEFAVGRLPAEQVWLGAIDLTPV